MFIYNLADGMDGFVAHHRCWNSPIHQSLVTHRVSTILDAHDHFYAIQKLAGILYKKVPQPSDPDGSNHSATEYGYKRAAMSVIPATSKSKF